MRKLQSEIVSAERLIASSPVEDCKYSRARRTAAISRYPVRPRRAATGIKSAAVQPAAILQSLHVRDTASSCNGAPARSITGKKVEFEAVFGNGADEYMTPVANTGCREREVKREADFCNMPGIDSRCLGGSQRSIGAGENFARFVSLLVLDGADMP